MTEEKKDKLRKILYKRKIHCKSQEESEAIQKILFSCGYRWNSKGVIRSTRCIYTDSHYLGKLTRSCSEDSRYFDKHTNALLDTNILLNDNSLKEYLTLVRIKEELNG